METRPKAKQLRKKPCAKSKDEGPCQKDFQYACAALQKANPKQKHCYCAKELEAKISASKIRKKKYADEELTIGLQANLELDRCPSI